MGLCVAWTCSAFGQAPTRTSVDTEIRTYLEKLQDSEAAVRYTTIEMLGTLGDRAIGVLIEEVLENPRRRFGELERRAAIDVLGMMGPAARPAIPVLVRLLGSERAGDTVLKVAAARALGKIGPESPEVIPALKEALKKTSSEEDIIVCRAAASALREIGRDGAAAVPELIVLLKSPTESMQHLAADALGSIGPQASPALPRLTALLKPDNPPAIRRAVAFALHKVGPAALEDPDDQVRRTATEAMNGLIPALEDPDVGVRRAAADALADFVLAVLTERGPAGNGVELIRKTVGSLIRQLEPDPRNNDVLVSAAAALRKIGPLANDSVPGLNALLRSRNWEVCRAAADALAAIGPDQESLRPLKDLLSHERPEVKQSATDALGKVGRRALLAVSDLRKLLGDAEHWEIRRSAADALAQIGPQAKEAVPDLSKVLAGDTDLVRRSAANALGQIGEVDPSTRRILRDLVEDKQPVSPMLRRAAIVALWRIGPEASLAPTLIRLLKDDPDWEVRRAAIDALGHIGLKAIDAVPQLREFLKQPAPWQVRRSAADALRMILARPGPADAGKVVSADVEKDLVDALLEDRDWEVRRAAAYAVVLIGPSEESSEPLVEALGDRDWVVRRCAADALAEIHPPPVPNLIHVLTDPGTHEPKSRASAAEALGQIRSKANPALPILTRTVATDLDSNIRTKALEAIREICLDLRANAGQQDPTDRRKSLHFVQQSGDILDVQSTYPKDERLVGQAKDSILEARKVLEKQEPASDWMISHLWWVVLLGLCLIAPVVGFVMARKQWPRRKAVPDPIEEGVPQEKGEGREIRGSPGDGALIHRAMLSIAREDLEEVRELLRPLMTDKDDRLARVTRAFPPHRYAGLIGRIKQGGEPGVFVGNLITTLLDYGDLEPGVPALRVLLESVKSEVGVSDRRRIERIIQGLVPRTDLN